MTEVIIAAAIVGGVGILIGGFLGLSAKKLHVEVDEKEVAVREALPGNNCGGCGYAGCDGLAAAIAKGEAPANGCSAGGAEVAGKIGKVLGQEVSVEKKVALLACKGTKECAKARPNYIGVKSCKAVALSANNTKLCSFGCIGLGDCVKVCKFGALSIGEDGLPKVDYRKCTGCGACVTACPKKLLSLTNTNLKGAIALCSNHSDNKPQIRKDCSAGCFKCGICAKKCPKGAIDISSGIPKIDYEKCISCRICVKACPDQVLVMLQDMFK